MLALLVHALSPPPPALLLQLWVAGRVAVAASAAQEAVSSVSSAAPGAADASTSCGLVVRLVRVLVFEEASESTPGESEESGGWRPGTQRLRCQYLYFCARKASKLSTWPARPAKRAADLSTKGLAERQSLVRNIRPHACGRAPLARALAVSLAHALFLPRAHTPSRRAALGGRGCDRISSMRQ